MKRVAVALAIVACSTASQPRTFDAPSAEKFRQVSNMLHARCGTLDCHGQPGRSLRVYGRFGLRLANDDVSGGGPIRPAEHDANYAAVVALEPEILHAVYNDGGRDPERLTLVRKARDLESHKGGDALDDNGVRCLESWLGGEVDEKACYASSILEKPPGFLEQSSGGTGGTSGSGGLGGSGGVAGTSFGGSGGSVVLGGSGGGGATASGGSGGGGGVVFVDFWPNPYDAGCAPIAPAPPDHTQYLKDDCMTCHKAGGGASEFLLGGIVWEYGASKGEEHIEVGLRDGNNFLYACTDALGLYFIPANGHTPPNWMVVETRIRAELGEKVMPPDKEHKPSCNEAECHSHADHQLWAP